MHVIHPSSNRRHRREMVGLRARLRGPVLALLAGAVAPCILAAPLYVDIDATSGSRDGSSWRNAFTNLQDALEISAEGIIWVAEGIYEGPFTLKENLTLYGGFEGIESALDQRDWSAHVTTLSGNSNRVVTGADNAVLDGFTLTGGYGAGGAVYMFRVNTSLLNCTFTNNTGGAAVSMEYTGYPDGAATLIRNCLFADNAGVSGGAILYNGRITTFQPGPHRLTIDQCRFLGNSATGKGGAMYSIYDFSTVSIRNCIFSGNTAAVGGALCIEYAEIAPGVVANCTFSANTATLVDDSQGGHAIALGTAGNIPSRLNLRNCILWGNDEQLVYLRAGSTLAIASCCIQNGTHAIYLRHGYEGNVVDEGGIIENNPVFFDADGPDNIPGTRDDDLRIGDGSPCIDSGTFVDAAPNDIDGKPRPQGNAPDIGAYETGTPPSGLLMVVQ